MPEKELVDVDGDYDCYLIFSLDDESYAFPGASVREIIQQTRIFFLPGCPPAILGVVNVRGSIESVLDFRAVLGRGAGSGEAGTILLAQTPKIRSGIRVDSVIDVVTLPRASVHEPHSTLPEDVRPFVKGVMPYREAAVAIFDIEKIFDAFLGSEA